MRIGGVNSFPPIQPQKAMQIDEVSPTKQSFGDMVSSAVGQVNEVQGQADDMVQKLATGDVQDIHQVMIALDKASTTFGMTVAVRNKALDAYQEIMKMQV